jgi:hypothetical protein
MYVCNVISSGCNDHQWTRWCFSINSGPVPRVGGGAGAVRGSRGCCEGSPGGTELLQWSYTTGIYHLRRIINTLTTGYFKERTTHPYHVCDRLFECLTSEIFDQHYNQITCHALRPYSNMAHCGTIFLKSGCGQCTLLGLTAVGTERSSNGDRVPGDAALVGRSQGGPTIWWRSREDAGWGQHGTDRRGELWERPMSSSGRLSAQMMMMIFEKRTLISI